MLRRLAMTLAMAAGSVTAQTIDRTKPPETPPIPDYKLSPTQELALPNGLKVVVVSDRRFPLVTARLVFGAGSKFDPQDMPGLSEIAATLLNAGTTTRTSRQIADETASLGGSIAASSTADSLIVQGDALSENFPQFLTLLGDVSMHATFPADEVNLQKQNGLENLKLQRSDPSFLAKEQFSRAVYGESAYAHIAPTEESIRKMDTAMFQKFRDSYLRADNATLILVGSLPDEENVKKAVSGVFGSWAAKASLPAAPAIEVPAPARKIYLVDRPGSVQADVNIGRSAPTRNSAEYFPLMVGNSILGGGANSRMFLEIREKQGLAYDAHTEYSSERSAAAVKAVTQVRNEAVEPALKAVLSELNKIATDPVPARELSGTKNYLAGTFVLRLTTQRGVADQIAQLDSLGLPASALGTYVTHVQSVEPDQIQAEAKKYLAPDQAAIVVVGDATKIGDAIRKMGDVTVLPAK
jgi:zinc protease